MAKATNIIKQFNNGTLIASVPKSKVRDMSFTDVSLLRDTFKENRKHLGTLKLFKELGIAKMPLIEELTSKKNYLYVNGLEGSFTWDVKLDATFPEVVEDVEEGEYLGIDGSTFKMKLTYPFRQNDILTYDPIDGVQVIVVGDEVEDTGDGFLHEVRLVSNNREAFFPKSKLEPGTWFGKIDNVIGEYDKKFSGIDSAISNSKATLEFRLGGARGVEVAWTTFSKSVKLGTGDNASQHAEVGNAMEMQMKKWQAQLGDMIAYGKAVGNGGIQVRQIDGILETLAMAEFYKMTATGIMFNQGATITGGLASKRINEGLYPMMRRGHRFTFSQVGELRAMIQSASDVIFQNSTIPVEDRELTFKGGYEIVKAIKQLYKTEFENRFPIPLEHRALPKPLLTGTDLNNLTLHSMAITTAFLNGIGNVTIEHDPSFDYDYGDFVSRGFVGVGGRSKRTWSMAIWDASDSMYSNALDKDMLPKGASFDPKSLGGNIYLVKPEGLPDVNTSRRIGRTEGQNVAAVLDYMGEEFAVWGSMASWIKDLTRVVLIEKADSADYSL
jgi:hypothetical protein